MTPVQAQYRKARGDLVRRHRDYAVFRAPRPGVDPIHDAYRKARAALQRSLSGLKVRARHIEQSGGRVPAELRRRIKTLERELSR